jgi:hypothetical protein
MIPISPNQLSCCAVITLSSTKAKFIIDIPLFHVFLQPIDMKMHHKAQKNWLNIKPVQCAHGSKIISTLEN